MQNESVFFTTNKYDKMEDSKIIEEIKQGDEYALTYLIKKISRISKHENK